MTKKIDKFTVIESVPFEDDDLSYITFEEAIEKGWFPWLEETL